MKLLPVILIIFSSLKYVRSKDPDFPALPFWYSADLQYNIIKRDRFAYHCRIGGDCNKREGGIPPLAELGRSIKIAEIFDDTKSASVLESVMEFSSGNNSQKAFNEIFIWNQGISGAENFIQFLDFEGRRSCSVDSVTSDSILDWLMGFDLDCKDGGECRPPNVGTMLHTVGNYTWDSKQEVRGIMTDMFTTKWTIDQWQADVSVRYYWSDRDVWTGTSGTRRSVPVRCEIAGEALDPTTNETVWIDESIDFMSFLEVQPGPIDFQPPKDMFCNGRVARDSLPQLPMYYMYGSELIFHFEHQDGDVHKVISPRSNWYDYEMGMARIDYKPLDLEHDHHGNPFENRAGVQTDIQDFIGGISYQIDNNFGNCSIVPIEQDFVGGITIMDGRIPVSDPMFIFHDQDLKFAYNGEWYERDILMGYFVGQKPSPTDKNFLWNMVTSLTASQYMIQDDGLGERLIPGQIQIYPDKSYDDLSQWRTYNIFKFSKQRGEFQDYNIIPCFEETHLLHLMITMSWRMDMDLEANNELQRYARFAIRSTAEITALRVQNIELLAKPDNSKFDLIFTLVDQPPVEDLGITLPIEAVRNLTECQRMLQEAVTAGTFTVSIPENSGGSGKNVTSTGLEMVVLTDRKGHANPDGPHVTYDKGYTSGDMAGLAFGMIFGGMLIAGAVYVFALRNKVRAGIPVMRGFDNPLQGLSNVFK